MLLYETRASVWDLLDEGIDDTFSAAKPRRVSRFVLPSRRLPRSSHSPDKVARYRGRLPPPCLPAGESAPRRAGTAHQLRRPHDRRRPDHCELSARASEGCPGSPEWTKSAGCSWRQLGSTVRDRAPTWPFGGTGTGKVTHELRSVSIPSSNRTQAKSDWAVEESWNPKLIGS